MLCYRRGWRVGAEAFCAVRSYIATARKHDVNVLDALRAAFARDPWLPPSHHLNSCLIRRHQRGVHARPQACHVWAMPVSESVRIHARALHWVPCWVPCGSPSAVSAVQLLAPDNAAASRQAVWHARGPPVGRRRRRRWDRCMISRWSRMWTSLAGRFSTRRCWDATVNLRPAIRGQYSGGADMRRASGSTPSRISFASSLWARSTASMTTARAERASPASIFGLQRASCRRTAGSRPAPLRSRPRTTLSPRGSHVRTLRSG